MLPPPSGQANPVKQRSWGNAMKQLSGSDTVFLLSEQKNAYNHVGMMVIYDVSTAPGGKVRVRDILKHFESRTDIHPIFRHRLSPSPLGIDRPYWVVDGEMDLEFHIRHVALPKPGDWRQLMIQVARMHSRPLDRSRPLWEAYIIEGLDNIPKLPPGSFALYMKFHHAAVDGMAAVHLATQFHSSSPVPDEHDSERKTVFVDRDPTLLEHVSHAVVNAMNRMVNAGKYSTLLSRKLALLGADEIGNYLSREEQPDRPGDSKKHAGSMEKIRFKKDVSAQRVFDGFGMPLSRIKRVRAKVPGATLNDIFLAVSGGAVRKYLQSKGELPTRSLTAFMPMSLRSDGAAGGNAIGAAMVKVCSDIADPIKRLKAANYAAGLGKAQAEKLGADLLANILESVPSIIGKLLVTKVIYPAIEMTVSNVRGPDYPLYLAGAKAMCFYPVSIPMNGVGLNITGCSYNKVLWVSMVSCRNMVPDPGFFVACMKEAWEEILVAADALPDPATDVVVSKKKPQIKVKPKLSKAAKVKKTVTAAKVVKPPRKAVKMTRSRRA